MLRGMCSHRPRPDRSSVLEAYAELVRQEVDVKPMRIDALEVARSSFEAAIEQGRLLLKMPRN
jgi:hypothetical protein